jgi:dTDP-4-dehydrorhamnose reductase/4-ketoreductase
MLGRDLMALLADSDATGIDRGGLDITDAASVDEVLGELRPTVVINAAAFTRVDAAETDETTALRVNGDGPGILARWCAAHSARLIHLSTDYVFAGDANAPYETDAPTSPQCAYGRTKLAGEHGVAAAGGDCHVVRTGWLYGAHGPSFVRAVGGRLARGETVDVVTDQRGAPTWTRELAARLIALGSAAVEPGIWHCSAAGEATWFDVAVALADLLGVPSDRVRPTTSAAMNRPAARPAYSVLSHRKWLDAGLPAMAEWRNALESALAENREALTT